jgi:hypothetical protein
MYYFVIMYIKAQTCNIYDLCPTTFDQTEVNETWEKAVKVFLSESFRKLLNVKLSVKNKEWVFSFASLPAFQMLAKLNRKMDDCKMTENKNLKNVGFFYKFFFSKQYFVEEPWSSGYGRRLRTERTWVRTLTMETIHLDQSLEQ